MFTVHVEKSEIELDNYHRGDLSSASFNRAEAGILYRNGGLSTCSLHEDGSSSYKWRGQTLENIRGYLTDTGGVMLQDPNYRTSMFDKDMQLIDSWEYKGTLITCLPGPRAVYAVMKERGGYVIDIRSQDGEVLGLQLDPDVRWSKSLPSWNSFGDILGDKLSVCEYAATGKLVVVDALQSQMNIFSHDGKPQLIYLYLSVMYLCMYKQRYRWMLSKHKHYYY